MMLFLTVSLSAVVLSTILLQSGKVSAAPLHEIPLEIEKIKEIADMFLSYCSGADCQALASQDTSARRHLLEEDSVANILLEATAAKHQGERKLDVQSCLLEILACHLYLDNLYMPQVEDYSLVSVSLADKGFEKQCESKTGAKNIEFVSSIKDIKDNEFLYLDKGPKSIQGVFSLDYEPCIASSLVSFAETRTSVGGISTGVLGDVDGEESLFDVAGPLRKTSDYVYAMRVLGDHNWAFGQEGKIVQGLVVAIDLVYKWVLLDGTLKNPKRFQIIPDIKIPFTCIRLEVKGCLESLLRFEQTLVEDCSEILPYATWNGRERAFRACEEGSVIWRRDNWFGNYGGPASPPSNGYFIIQVVDGSGKKIEPAWSEFVNEQQRCDIAFFDNTCTTNFYGALKGKGSSNAGYCQCAYTGDTPYGLDNLNPFLDDGSGKGMKRGRRRGLTGETKTQKNDDLEEDEIKRELQSFFEMCPDYTISPTSTPSPTSSPPKAKKGKNPKR